MTLLKQLHRDGGEALHQQRRSPRLLVVSFNLVETLRRQRAAPRQHHKSIFSVPVANIRFAGCTGIYSLLQFIGKGLQLLTIIHGPQTVTRLSPAARIRLRRSRWALSFDFDVRNSPLPYRFSRRSLTAISRLSPEERKRTPQRDNIAQPYFPGLQRIAATGKGITRTRRSCPYFAPMNAIAISPRGRPPGTSVWIGSFTLSRFAVVAPCAAIMAGSPGLAAPVARRGASVDPDSVRV